MKKYTSVFVILIAIVSFFSLPSYKNVVSSNNAWKNCASCHNGSSANSIVDSFYLIDVSTGMAVTQYVGGNAYYLRMRGHHATNTGGFGFQMRQTATTKGTFSNFPTNVGLQSLGYVTQSFRISAVSGAYIVQVKWTAPPAGTGNVVFDGFINAVDGNGSDNSADCVSATKSITITENVATVLALDCNNISSSGTLTNGTAASGVSFSVPYTGATSGNSYNSTSASSTGVTGLTATLTAGTFSSSSGNLTFNISGTPSSSGTASFTFTVNGQSCTYSLTVNPSSGSSFSLNCAGVTTTGTLTKGTAASGVKFTIPFSNATTGSTYSTSTANSTIVTGLTATLTSGTFATASGNLTMNITGTPASAGTASFNFTINGQSCTKTISVANIMATNQLTEKAFILSYNDNSLIINGPAIQGSKEVSIFNMSGRKIYTANFDDIAEKVILTHVNLLQGTYIIQINGQDLTISKKLLVK